MTTPKRVIRLPPTQWEDRAPFYEDVEDLICPGFLTHTVEIGPVRLALRSLGSGDVYFLKARAEGALEWGWRAWAVASSIWLWDGHCLLESPHLTPYLYKLVCKLPEPMLDFLYGIVRGLFKRMEVASEALEPFCYELKSRRLWKSFGGRPPHEFTAVPGVNRTGGNFIQRMWIAFNVAEDQDKVASLQWEYFKFVASANAPKGVQKVSQRDLEDKRREEQRRKEACDVWFYQTLGLLEKVEEQEVKNLRIHPSSKSPDQLEEEFKAWVEGRDDWHDKIVNEYKHNLIQARNAKLAARQERMKQLQAARETLEAENIPATEIIGYTAEQMQEILSKRGAGPGTVKRIYDHVDEKQRHVTAWLQKHESSGQIQVDGGRLIAPKVATENGVDDISYHIVQPKKPSLSEQILRRDIAFKTEEGG